MSVVILFVLVGIIFFVDVFFNPKIDKNIQTKDILLHYTYKNKRKWIILWKN